MIIVGNFKEYLSRFEDVDNVARVVGRIKTKHEIILAPSFAHLGIIASRKGIKHIAAQDISIFDAGAHTGEVSGATLQNIGATHVIVGHSERREQGEDDHIVATKIQQALRSNLKVILCIGERERDPHGGYLAFLSEQITSALGGVSEKDYKNILIAYEPIWAIGKNADSAITGESLEETVLYIRKILKERVDEKAFAHIKILYGGSVSAINIANLVVPHIEGFLVGRASTHPDSLKELLNALDS